MNPSYKPLWWVLYLTPPIVLHTTQSYFSSKEEVFKILEEKDLRIGNSYEIYHKNNPRANCGFISYSLDDKSLIRCVDIFDEKQMDFLKTKWNLPNLTQNQIVEILKHKGFARTIYISTLK